MTPPRTRGRNRPGPRPALRSTLHTLTAYALLSTAFLTTLVVTGRTTTNNSPHTALIAASLQPDPHPDLSEQALALINHQRRTAACPPLRPVSDLNATALHHTTFMARTNALVHSSETPLPHRHTRAATDYTRRAYGENIARDYPTPASVVTAWMNSPGHRHNILNCAYRHSGLSMIQHQGRTWWTHILTTAP